MEIKTIGVVGAGQMGSGIAHVAAMSGYDVILTDISAEVLEKAVAGIENNMNRGLKRLDKKLSAGALSQDEHIQKHASLKESIALALVSYSHNHRSFCTRTGTTRR